MRRIKINFGIFLVLDAAIGALTGVAVTPDGAWRPWSASHIALECIGLVVTILALARAEIDFGDPDLGPGKRRGELLSLLCLLLVMMGIISTSSVPWELCFNALMIATSAIAMRGKSMMLAGAFAGVFYTFFGPWWCERRYRALACADYSPQNYDEMPHACDWCGTQDNDVWLANAYPDGLHVMLLLFVCSYTTYVRDQRLSACIIAQPYYIYQLVSTLRQKTRASVTYNEFTYFALFCLPVTIYLNLLFRRRMRHLPRGLEEVKFVRLGYLRKLHAEGKSLRRCQDLPEEAFGNPSKSAYLIIVSHRWLDPLACDVRSDTYPHGLKLGRLVRRLEEYFSPAAFIYKELETLAADSRIGSQHSRSQHLLHMAGRMDMFFSSNLKAIKAFYDAYALGGSDILIFFDFMSVPQHGIGADGSVVLRSSEDQAIFDACMGHMGVLYSIFPVLVLTDVPEGDEGHDYHESGWCVCEFLIASLGDRLRPYSAEAADKIAELMPARDARDAAAIDSATADQISCNISRALALKHFLYYSDREVAQGIVEGFLLKRLLADSIRANALGDVCALLVHLTHERRQAILDSPLDDGLNSPLHLAVQSRCTTITAKLLELGANPRLRNLRGDTPDEWLNFPRCSHAARKSQRRKWRQRQCKGATSPGILAGSSDDSGSSDASYGEVSGVSSQSDTM